MTDTGSTADRTAPTTASPREPMIVGWAHTKFGKSEAPDTMALMAEVAGPALAHAGVAASDVDGIFTGVWTAGETMGLALGPFLVVSFVLGLSGYVASSGGEAVVQPDSAMRAIVWAVALVPALFVLASMPFVLAHNTPAEIEESQVIA